MRLADVLLTLGSMLVAVLGAGAGTAACGGSGLPRPTFVQVQTSDYVPVPFPPRVPTVEIVPDRPREDAVWVDGSWAWDGERYRWQGGGWVIAPPGARLARWVLVRRPYDGQLFFAPSTWRDAQGRTLPAPDILARARAREGKEVEE